MTIEIELINVGLVANDGRGDDLRTTNQKTNRNLTKVAAAASDAQAGAASAVSTAAAALAASVGAARQADLLACLSGPVPDGFPVRRGQFLAALELSGAGRTALCAAAVPTDAGDPINRAWFHTTFVTPGCALASFVTATLSAAGIAADPSAILSAARTITE